MNWTVIKHVIKGRGKGLLHLVPATQVIRLDCLADKCAKCCKTLGGPILTSSVDEAKIDAAVIVKDKHGMYVKSENSTCCLLEKGLCSIYPNRPRGCREYPWYNISGELYYDSGCPGMKYDEDGRPAVNDVQPFENFLPGVPRLIAKLVVRICLRP